MDSFLSNDSEGEELEAPRKPQISKPDRKMYAIQIPFYTALCEDMGQLRTDIQKMLVALTGMEEGEAKRLPYTVFRSFERALKDLRKLKAKVVEENKKLTQPLLEREKIKQHKNANFKHNLKKLNETRNELKEYINKVEARVQRLEDSGYAQYVDYHIYVPEVFTIRLSYSSQNLLRMVQTRQNSCSQIAKQLKRRKDLIDLCFRLQPQNEGIERTRLPLLREKNIIMSHCLHLYLSYKFYIDQRILQEERIKRRNRIKKRKDEIQILKKAIQQTQEAREKQEVQLKIGGHIGGFTKTDHMIYLKSMGKQIHQLMENKILDRFVTKGKKSWSVPK